jgi:hypothetical protein
MQSPKWHKILRNRLPDVGCLEGSSGFYIYIKIAQKIPDKIQTKVQGSLKPVVSDQSKRTQPPPTCHSPHRNIASFLIFPRIDPSL